MKLLEKDFQQQIIELAQLYGWKVAHFRHAWSKDGKRCHTPVQADGKGFPDLCMVKRVRIIFAEVKGDNGKMSAEQEEWLKKLYYVAETYLWRPHDWERIQEILTRE